MTWLPISLKNAAKCDKWYQLQNPSITESLNAKGAWEKLFTSHPRACHILSVEQKTFLPFFLSRGRVRCEALREPLTLDEHTQTIRVGAVLDHRDAFGHSADPKYESYKQQNQKTTFFDFCCTKLFCTSFTDLSVAGLPAELKHITQRRKRKQP